MAAGMEQAAAHNKRESQEKWIYVVDEVTVHRRDPCWLAYDRQGCTNLALPYDLFGTNTLHTKHRTPR